MMFVSSTKANRSHGDQEVTVLDYIKVANSADHRLAAYSHLVQAADRGTGGTGPAPGLQSPSLPGGEEQVGSVLLQLLASNLLLYLGEEQVGPVLLLASNLLIYLGAKNR
jgi:hypothetical protein